MKVIEQTLGGEQCTVVLYDGGESPSGAHILGAGGGGDAPGGSAPGGGRRKTVIICDRRLRDTVGAVPKDGVTVCFLPGDESKKRWSSVAKILRILVAKRIERDDVVIGIGGGVLCDMVAFAASIYRRGVTHYLVPSTLLAMVDAAFGGKTGINFAGYKNMVGSYRAAKNLLVYPAFLQTLPQRELLNGLAEAIKAGMLGDARLLELLTQNQHKICLERDAAMLAQVIERSLRVKADIVCNDYRESGQRAYLNLGHTFAHALEAVRGLGRAGRDRVGHGEAVAWGLGQAMRLGMHLGVTDKQYAAEIITLLQAYGYQLTLGGVRAERLIDAMRNDKKVVDGQIRFVLQRRQGATEIIAVDEDTVAQILSGHST